MQTPPSFPRISKPLPLEIAEQRSGDRLPLSFPKSRWTTFDAQEQRQFQEAQLLLDALSPVHMRTARALARDTRLQEEALGTGLGLLEDMGLIEVEERDEGVVVSLVATPEEHLEVQFPDGFTRWIFVSRPVREPEIDASDLN